MISSRSPLSRAGTPRAIPSRIRAPALALCPCGRIPRRRKTAAPARPRRAGKVFRAAARACRAASRRSRPERTPPRGFSLRRKSISAETVFLPRTACAPNRLGYRHLPSALPRAPREHREEDVLIFCGDQHLATRSPTRTDILSAPCRKRHPSARVLAANHGCTISPPRGVREKCLRRSLSSSSTSCGFPSAHGLPSRVQDALSSTSTFGSFSS